MRAQFLLPTVGVIKPTDKIPLGSYIEDIEEMHKKTIDPVTGRLFLKYSLQDDLKQKLERERERFEARFSHIETQEDFDKIKEKADQEYRLIREMSVDNDQILPDERTRHWMLAQTHILMEEGKEAELELLHDVKHAVDPDRHEKFNAPSEVERARAKRAYSAIQDKLKARDMNSDNLFEDLISEKAFDLDRVSTIVFSLISTYYSSYHQTSNPQQLTTLFHMLTRCKWTSQPILFMKSNLIRKMQKSECKYRRNFHKSES
jgi:hypothetical protein